MHQRKLTCSLQGTQRKIFPYRIVQYRPSKCFPGPAWPSVARGTSLWPLSAPPSAPGGWCSGCPASAARPGSARGIVGYARGIGSRWSARDARGSACPASRSRSSGARPRPAAGAPPTAAERRAEAAGAAQTDRGAATAASLAKVGQRKLH